MNTTKIFKQKHCQDAMVMLPLSQYDALMEYLEDIEDRMTIKERANEKDIAWKHVEKKFKKKFKIN